MKHLIVLTFSPAIHFVVYCSSAPMPLSKSSISYKSDIRWWPFYITSQRRHMSLFRIENTIQAGLGHGDRSEWIFLAPLNDSEGPPSLYRELFLALHTQDILYNQKGLICYLWINHKKRILQASGWLPSQFQMGLSSTGTMGAYYWGRSQAQQRLIIAFYNQECGAT